MRSKQLLIVGVVIICLLGIILLSHLLSSSSDTRSRASDIQVQNSLTLQKQSVSMSINPGTGAVGTTVEITISSQVDITNATVRFVDDEGNKATTIQKLKDLTPAITPEHVTTYRFNYIIPPTAVVEDDSDSQKAEPITMGTGRFVLNYNGDQSPNAVTDNKKLLQIPFTITK